MRYLLLAVLLLPAGACSIFNPYSSNFSCPGYHPGVCGSIETVYRMYKQGRFSSQGASSLGYWSYVPETCVEKKICKECKQETTCQDPCACNDKPKKKLCCKKVVVCYPDSVSQHVDYRAQAVKDNEYKGEVVW
jgi:hypothetical protein